MGKAWPQEPKEVVALCPVKKQRMGRSGRLYKLQTVHYGDFLQRDYTA